MEILEDAEFWVGVGILIFFGILLIVVTGAFIWLTVTR